MDQVCRRCEINLQTGKPATIECRAPSRQTASSPLQALGPVGPAAEKARAVINSLIEKAAPRKTAEAAPRPAEAAAKETKPAPAVPGGKLAAALYAKLRPDKGVTTLQCPHCAGKMEIKKERPYSRAGPIALMAAAAVLAAAGLFVPVLFITSAMAAAAGTVYMRMGKTYWRCDSCGFTVKRTE